MIVLSKLSTVLSRMGSNEDQEPTQHWIGGFSESKCDNFLVWNRILFVEPDLGIWTNGEGRLHPDLLSLPPSCFPCLPCGRRTRHWLPAWPFNSLWKRSNRIGILILDSLATPALLLGNLPVGNSQRSCPRCCIFSFTAQLDLCKSCPINFVL